MRSTNLSSKIDCDKIFCIRYYNAKSRIPVELIENEDACRPKCDLGYMSTHQFLHTQIFFHAKDCFLKSFCSKFYTIDK